MTSAPPVVPFWTVVTAFWPVITDSVREAVALDFEPLTRFWAWVSGVRDQRAKEQRRRQWLDQWDKHRLGLGGLTSALALSLPRLLLRQARVATPLGELGQAFAALDEIQKQLHQLRSTLVQIAEKAEKTQGGTGMREALQRHLEVPQHETDENSSETVGLEAAASKPLETIQTSFIEETFVVAIREAMAKHQVEEVERLSGELAKLKAEQVELAKAERLKAERDARRQVQPDAREQSG